MLAVHIFITVVVICRVLIDTCSYIKSLSTMEDTDYFDSCYFGPRRNRTLLSQLWSGKIGYGIWHEKYAAVKCKWLWQVNTIVL